MKGGEKLKDRGMKLVRGMYEREARGRGKWKKVKLKEGGGRGMD